MSKGSGHVTDGDATFSNPSITGAKRSHQWFVDAAESELFPDKKQAIQTANGKLSSGLPYACNPWENSSSFQSAPNQFIDRLFGSETARPINFAERSISSVGMDDLNLRRKDNDNQFDYNRENTVDLHTGQAPDRGNGAAFMLAGQTDDKEHANVALTGQTYNRVDAHIRSAGSNNGRRDENAISIGDTYSKGDTDIISFGGFSDEQDIISVGRPVDSYDKLYHQSSQTSETAYEKELDAPKVNAVVTNHGVKRRPDKPEYKTSKKEAPNSFPSNVRSLISTGMLDGVPVKYVSLTREVLNAYEFERHAGCKTKHPNNHIYFENGKTIYQIVQELRSTPESLLFDTIQTVFGAPINQKSFRIWKESFQAATRELHRIYGKEELNL
ncbi:hypothetical protein FEM48_Zijuj02G0081200 [Ziziphus jujuba var. spinosa]|uniref:Tify domain-containing protein n=1 Tax=Ziziphus jujuba var. spinosa TaxID=714518 RepID=A0A978VUL1_ZIZJJ|nr:hypothetical protein FEM48_Zijuj02G0081200 [Ziziphus jujuba var. spinosa]